MNLLGNEKEAGIKHSSGKVWKKERKIKRKKERKKKERKKQTKEREEQGTHAELVRIYVRRGHKNGRRKRTTAVSSRPLIT
jgi:molecular chaperone DnaK (HSP70)